MTLRTPSLSLFLATLLTLGCENSERPTEAKRLGASPTPSAANGTLRAASNPTTAPSAKASSKEGKLVLELPRSAYSALLHVHGKELFVVTPAGIARRKSDGEFEQREVNLGSAFGARHDEFVFAKEGALKRFVWGDKVPKELVSSKGSAERVGATDSAVFALHRTPDGHSQLSTVDGTALRKLYESETSIAALSAKDSDAYFVESTEGGFRLGRVGRDGSTTFGPSHPGRTPSALTVTDAVYYYDGPRGEVRRASTNLEREDVVARDVVCSPMHVSERLYCAYPGKLVALRLDGSQSLELELQTRGPVTAVTTLENELLWVEDAGPDRLVVRNFALD